MLAGIIQQMNYLDLIILIVLFRICYVAIKSGVIAEAFKLLGIVAAIFISSHYYTSISDILRRHYASDTMPLEFADFIVFILLSVFVYLVFSLLRGALQHFIKMEALPNVNRYGGLILGIFRWYFTVGLLIYILMISSVSYMIGSVKHSYLGDRFSVVSANTYQILWNGVFSKFSSRERLNSVVEETKNDFAKK